MRAIFVIPLVLTVLGAAIGAILGKFATWIAVMVAALCGAVLLMLFIIHRRNQKMHGSGSGDRRPTPAIKLRKAGSVNLKGNHFPGQTLYEGDEADSFDASDNRTGGDGKS